jgi:predicted transcriptional regulator
MGKMGIFVIDKYLNAIPAELVRVMHSLGERKESWGILFMMADRRNYTIKEITRWFPHMSKNIIREKYIAPLITAGLLQHHSPSLVELVEHEKSVYNISSLGERILKVMELALEVFPEPRPKSSARRKRLKETI